MNCHPAQKSGATVGRLAAMASVLASIVLILSAGVVVAAPPAIPSGYSSEIIDIKFRDDSEVDFLTMRTALPAHLGSAIASISRLFSLPEATLDRLRTRGASSSRRALPDLNRWFRITVTTGADSAALLEELRRLPNVEIAEPAPLPQPPPAITPDFTGNQGYLDVAPGGIDARFTWTIPGGNGAGITIYDVEYSWNQTHEDLSAANGVALLLNPGDSAVDPFSDNNHGTAVLGEIIADNDAKGVTGISWGAGVGLAPANTANLGYNPANAIILAMAAGAPGDVILIEQQICVCNLTCPNDGTQRGLGPSEWSTPVFNAIQTAVAGGLVVVEASGNGNVNLDEAACGTAFDRTVRDSGAIIVGAGQPPGSGSDRQREGFSTYGSRVDVQGWGSGVMTTGYGTFYVDPDNPANPNFWYTATFGGTSSASPMVSGAAANLQGMALVQSGVPQSPAQIRELLVLTGSPQLGDTTEHIGPRPNLREASRFIVGPFCFGVPATIIGTEGNDVLLGTPGDDVIVGLGGNDLIYGFGGNDLICGGDGNDVIAGGDGDDMIDGGMGKDLIKGQMGNDQLFGCDGDDIIEGGVGDDFLDGGAGRNILNGGVGVDICVNGPTFRSCNP